MKIVFTTQKINSIIKNLCFLFILALLLRASFFQFMGGVVHYIPAEYIWSYKAITPLKQTYKVGDVITFISENTRNVDMRIVWEDYLYCDDSKKERYLYTSTLYASKGEQSSEWAYGKTKRVGGYILKAKGETCYILSHQIGLPYGQEIIQEYMSGPFNIVK